MYRTLLAMTGVIMLLGGCASTRETERISVPGHSGTGQVSLDEVTVKSRSSELDSDSEVDRVSPGSELRLTGDESGQNQQTLSELVALAEQVHPKLQATRSEIDELHGKAIQAGLYPNPIFSTSSPQIAGNSSQYNTFVSQDLITAGKLRLDQGAVAHEIAKAEWKWQEARWEVVTEIRRHYFSALAAQARLAVHEKIVEVTEASVVTAQKLNASLSITQADVLLTETELEKARLLRANAESEWNFSRKQLAASVGLPDLVIESLEGDLTLPIPEVSLEQVRAIASEQSPQVGMARSAADEASIRLERARIEPTPNLNLMAGYQRAVSPPDQNQGIFQLSVEIPIWDRNEGNIRAAAARLATARSEIEQTKLKLNQESVERYGEYLQANERAEQLDQVIIPKAKAAIEITEKLVEALELDFSRQLQAQRTLHELELARIEAHQARWSAAIELARLLQWEEFGQD